MGPPPFLLLRVLERSLDALEHRINGTVLGVMASPPQPSPPVTVLFEPKKNKRKCFFEIKLGSHYYLTKINQSYFSAYSRDLATLDRNRASLRHPLLKTLLSPQTSASRKRKVEVPIGSSCALKPYSGSWRKGNGRKTTNWFDIRRLPK
jgi:hypothetical protein